MKGYIIQMTCIMHFKINLGYWCWPIPLTLGATFPRFSDFSELFQHISTLFESPYKKKLQTYLGPEMKKMFTASAINIKYFRSFFFIFMKQAFLCFTYATDLKFCKHVKNNTYMSKTIHHNHLLMIICYAVNMLM